MRDEYALPLLHDSSFSLVTDTATCTLVLDSLRAHAARWEAFVLDTAIAVYAAGRAHYIVSASGHPKNDPERVVLTYVLGTGRSVLFTLFPGN